MPLEIDPIVAREVVEKYGERAQGKSLINSHSAKGFHVIRLDDGDRWYWFDVKTAGYKQANYVGKHVLRGGNWVNPEDKNPLDVYLREVGKEETAQTPVGRVVRNSVRGSTAPYADFLEISPIEAHGNPAMREIFPYADGTIFGMTSVFETEIDGEELVLEIRKQNPDFVLNPENLRQELKRISKESDVSIVTTEQCETGEMPQGAWGDDQKFEQFLLERGYLLEEPNIPKLPGVECFKLSSNPLTPFKERREVPLYRTNPFREAAKDKELFM